MFLCNVERVENEIHENWSWWKSDETTIASNSEKVLLWSERHFVNKSNITNFCSSPPPFWKKNLPTCNILHLLQRAKSIIFLFLKSTFHIHSEAHIGISHHSPTYISDTSSYLNIHVFKGLLGRHLHMCKFKRLYTKSLDVKF